MRPKTCKPNFSDSHMIELCYDDNPKESSKISFIVFLEEERDLGKFKIPYKFNKEATRQRKSEVTIKL